MTIKQLKKWVETEKKIANKLKLKARDAGNFEDQNRFYGMELAFMSVLMAMEDESL